MMALVRAKFDFDVVGHYARPDVFGFWLKGQQGQTFDESG